MTAAFGCTREASGDAPCKTWCKSKDCVRSEAGWPTDADYESLWSIAAEIAKDRHRPARLIFGALVAEHIAQRTAQQAAQPQRAEQAAQPVAQEPRVCWLVEEFSDSGNSTGRYMLDQNGLTITTDAQQARRFLGSRTATFRATDMREKWGTSWRPVSHVFRAAQPQQAAQPVAPVGWLYDWTHSSATGRPDERFTSFTADEVYAFKGMGHENVRPVYAAAQPQQATEGSRLSDLRGLLADAQPKQPNGQA